MKTRVLKTTSLIVFNCFVLSLACANPVYAIKKPGIFLSTPNAVCTAALKSSSQGGFLQLYIGADKNSLAHIADDVTGIAWATSSTLIYSVSPVYGNPGVFLVKCDGNHEVTTLVSAKHIDSAYPKGSDYFEIRSVAGDHIEYYYGDDVDKIDFTKLRYGKNVRLAPLPKIK